ncbi:MAG: transcriptional regulator [Flaviaesturariibacter sp.]|nr:transcriptional regulator [Flaviaesturariibacter sp.]
MMQNTVREERGRKRLTQQQLADLIGVSRQTINAIEAGNYVPSTLLSLKLSQVFEVPINDFFFLKKED